MRIIRNKIIPFGAKYAAINLFGLLFVKNGVDFSPRLINHELIHSIQGRELLWVPFYIVYVLEWIWRVVQFHGNLYQAYRHISFEEEAYRNEHNLNYLNSRPRFGMWRK